MAHALLDAYEATLDQRYFVAAELGMTRTLVQYWDAEEGGFFDRAWMRLPWAASTCAASRCRIRRLRRQCVAAIVLARLHGFTGNSLYRERAEATLEAFAGVVSKYGMFAASYGLAALLHSRGAIQVIVTGRADDPAAQQLERSAAEIIVRQAVLRITPEAQSAAWLAPALAQTVPSLRADVPAALVCVETTCSHP